MGKKKKSNPEGITSSVGGNFFPKRKKKGLGPMTPAREAVRKEIRDIVNHAREEKDALKRKVTNVSKNGIKGLKVDGARLLNMLKDLKFKEESSLSAEAHQPSSVSNKSIKQAQPSIVIRSKEASYYDTWFYIIETELKTVKKKF